MKWFQRCYCFNFKWPLVWRIDADTRRLQELRHAEALLRKELDDEREALQKLIPRVAKISDRQFGRDGIYTLNIQLDNHFFSYPYNQKEREYFAEYVGREVECQVSRLVVVRPIDPETSRAFLR